MNIKEKWFSIKKEPVQFITALVLVPIGKRFCFVGDEKNQTFLRTGYQEIHDGTKNNLETYIYGVNLETGRNVKWDIDFSSEIMYSIND